MGRKDTLLIEKKKEREKELKFRGSDRSAVTTTVTDEPLSKTAP